MPPRIARTLNAAAANGVHFHIGDKKKQDEEPEELSGLDLLFQRLGGQGKIRFYRQREDGEEPGYVGILHVNDELLDSFEETIARRFGGGTFVCKGFVGPKCVSVYPITIDPAAFPPKASEAETNRGFTPPNAAPALPPARSPEIDALARVVQELQATVQRLATPAAAPQGIPIEKVLGLIADRADADRGLFRELLADKRAAAGAAPTTAPAADPLADLKRLKSYRDTLAEMGMIPATGGGAGDADDPKRSFGRSLLERSADRIADKAADRIGDRIAKAFEDESGAKSPAVQTPAANGGGAPALPAPSAPKIPSGAVLIKSSEQLQALRKGFRPSAPPAAEVMPDKK